MEAIINGGEDGYADFLSVLAKIIDGKELPEFERGKNVVNNVRNGRGNATTDRLRDQPLGTLRPRFNKAESSEDRAEYEQNVNDYLFSHYSYKELVEDDQEREREERTSLFDSAFFDADYSTERDPAYHAGDLGKAEYLDIQDGGRGTGHFGTGTYFIGDKEKIRNHDYYGKRPEHSVDFSKFNLYRPKDARDAYRLHDALRIVDGGIDVGMLDELINSYGTSPTYVDAYQWKYYASEFYNKIINSTTPI